MNFCYREPVYSSPFRRFFIKAFYLHIPAPHHPFEPYRQDLKEFTPLRSIFIFTTSHPGLISKPLALGKTSDVWKDLVHLSLNSRPLGSYHRLHRLLLNHHHKQCPQAQPTITSTNPTSQAFRSRLSRLAPKEKIKGNGSTSFTKVAARFGLEVAEFWCYHGRSCYVVKEDGRKVCWQSDYLRGRGFRRLLLSPQIRMKQAPLGGLKGCYLIINI
jgi:hypothetical protein